MEIKGATVSEGGLPYLAEIQAVLKDASRSVAELLRFGERLDQAEKPEAALAVFETVVARNPEILGAWHAVATLRFRLGRPQAALSACNSALRLAPEDATTLFNVAVVLASLGDMPAALHCYRRVLAIEPSHRGAMLNLPQLLSRVGLAADALVAAARFAETFPLDADIVFNHGELLTGAGQHTEALSVYSRASALCPNVPRFAIAAAVAQAASGGVRAARDELNRLRGCHPAEFSDFNSPLLTDQAAAIPELEAGRIALISTFERYRCCDWRARDTFLDLFVRQIDGADGKVADNPDLPFLGIGLPIDGSLRLRLAQNVACRIADSVKGQRLVRPRQRSGRRLRIGYLSGDFRLHATAFLMSRLPGLHDRQKFEVFVYSSGPVDESPARTEIIRGADAFCDVRHFDSVTTAQRIVRDGIDILVDLSGYTLYAKSAALALRPAALQVSYLAYLQTSGSNWIDYVLLDRKVLLDEERCYWQERVAYLPDTFYLCDDRRFETAKCYSRTGMGLPEDRFVFCCLSAPWKIDPETFACWMSILRQAPRSVLWLYDDTGRAAENLRHAAVAAGVEASRLFFSPRLPQAEHLSRFPLADLFLDTFSCNAHTTCVEALSVGLPVLTVPGDTVVARVASSLLNAHGVSELIAESRDAYVELACRAALDSEWYAAVRSRVASAKCSRLFATGRRVREIERAYEIMWARHQAGLAPEDFDVSPLDSLD